MKALRKVQPGIVDDNGMAECPDCGTIVHCSKVGIANLEKCHRNSEACKKAAARRDKNSQKKSTSILDYLRPKAVKVPSLAPTPIVLGLSSANSVELSLQHERLHKSADISFLIRLQSLVSHLPESISEASPNDALADFSHDPAHSVDPGMNGEDIWELMLNPMLKNHFGWGKTMDMTNVIRQGPLGMDGFISFIQYFVTQRGVPVALVEQKLEHLMETLEKIGNFEPNSKPCQPATEDDIQQPIDASNNDRSQIIEVSDLIDTMPVKWEVGSKPCKGYQLVMPEGCSPHLCHPFSLHNHMSLPWDYAVKNGIMSLFAQTCLSKPTLGYNNCQPCRDLAKNSVLEGIIRRMKNGIHESTPRSYYSLLHAFELLDHKTAQIDYLRLRGLNQACHLISHATALADHKRFMLAIASGKYERVDRLVRIALDQRRGIRGILTLYDAAARQIYRPKSFTEEDAMRALLLWRLGGNQIAQIAQRALGLPSLTTLRHFTTMEPIIPSAGIPHVLEIQKNVESTFKSLEKYLDSKHVVHQVLMFDELAIEKRIRWDHKTNLFLGLCRQHSKNVSLEFNTEQDMEEVFEAVDNCQIHTAAEATIGALGILSNNHCLYPARGILISGDCKCESGEEHAKVIKTTIDGVNSQKSINKLRIVSIASDGETRRGSALSALTFKRTLLESSNIFPLISPLLLMNLLVGDDDITADKDWKHVIKRLCNLILCARGIVINSIHITPAIIQIHLKCNGHSAEHIRSLFNPEDQQDVKLAFDLLKDIWLLPQAPDSQAPGFVHAQAALCMLGGLLHHIVFPYICVDLTLSEQIEHLSAATHLTLALYRQAEKEFLPTLLYVDLMIMIKNAIFCVAKAKVDDPDGSFWLMLLGTDRLETLFGILRTMIGSDANLDVLQLFERITSTTEANQCLGADILSPFGVLLVNKSLDEDDIDESIDLDADLNSLSDLTVPNDRVEVEDALEEEEIAHAKLSSMQKPFDRCINIEGRDILKHELYLCA
ncbi:hypothetical protein C0992_004688, partial [Termitomyces sp. T32_za158]